MPADELDLRDLRVIAHPLRLRLLSLLTGTPMSAAEAARELGETHANVSYHLRRLLASGLLEVVGVERIRGGAAKRYRHVPASGERLDGITGGSVPALLTALAAELTRRAALHAEGTPPVFTDAALTVSTGTWIRVQELGRELGTVLHDDSARRPGDEDVAVSATVALFRTAAAPADPGA